MYSIAQKSFWFLSLSFASFFVGCGGSSGPDVVPVSGKITYQGQPVPNASVTFVPTQGPMAIGMTNEAGEFQLKTGPQEGAVPGTYKVTVYAVEATESRPLPENPDEITEADYEVKPAKWLIPEKYGTATNSPLSQEVTEGGDNHFEIQLID